MISLHVDFLAVGPLWLLHEHCQPSTIHAPCIVCPLFFFVVVIANDACHYDTAAYRDFERRMRTDFTTDTTESTRSSVRLVFNDAKAMIGLVALRVTFASSALCHQYFNERDDDFDRTMMIR